MTNEQGENTIEAQGGVITIKHVKGMMNQKKSMMNQMSNCILMSNGKQNAIFFGSGPGALFITCHVAKECSSDIWSLVSGCSNHMTGNRDIFESLDTSIKSKIKLFENIVEVRGKGIIVVMTNLVRNLFLTCILYLIFT